MADTHEEQLLSELLCAIGDADRAAETSAVAELEARVLASCNDASSGSRGRIWKPVVVAGVAAALVMAVSGTWLSRERRGPVAATNPAPAAQWSELPAPSYELPVASSQSLMTQSPIAQSPTETPITQSPITHSSMPQPLIPNPQPPSAMEFVPLMPLTEHELSGPFQIVRVQVPLASLGGLTSPLQHPGELVQADVLLGEDGIARGIRIASDESNYPWRFR